MPKKFNITGTCIPERHYMVDISNKLNAIMEMVEQGDYFTINRPRQYGKTTTKFLLEKELKKRDDYLAIRISFEGIGDVVFNEEDSFIQTFISLMKRDLKFSGHTKLATFIDKCKRCLKFEELNSLLTDLSLDSEKKLVLLIDEVDKSSNNQLFLSFLGILRTKYLMQNEGKDRTFHSVILAGVHDVKTMKLKIRPDAEQKYNSPWNIAVDFKVDMSFNPAEIATMLSDYSEKTATEMDIDTISKRIYHYSNGYPFLVSRICKEIDEEILPLKKTKTWQTDDVDTGVKVITGERNTNFESLVKNIENHSELYRLAEDIVVGNLIHTYNALDPVINLGEIYGLFKNRSNRIVFHNKIYEEIITNYITSKLTREKSREIAQEAVRSGFVKPNDNLDIEKVLFKFQDVIREKYSKTDLLKSDEFLEKDLRLLFLVFLNPIINGIGFSFKEVETGEEKRLDIVILFRNEKFVVELKIWRGQEYHKKGINRLKEYMKSEGVDKGYMLIMDKGRHKEFTHEKQSGILMVWV
ncbi:MAG: AAA-like domain-containing protein [Bacteroidetes bacterium]|nr:AAA-like domain-containing protein [Bacteroidota bacterium]